MTAPRRKAFPTPTPEQEAHAIRLANRGEPYSAICAEVGITDKQARRIVSRAGLDAQARQRQKKGQAVQWTDAMLEEVQQRWEDGETVLQIAEAMDLPEGAVEGKRVILGLYRDDPITLARLARPDGKHRAAALARLGLDPEDAARFPRRIALVAAAIAMEQAR
jgi:hypothetical protein